VILTNITLHLLPQETTTIYIFVQKLVDTDSMCCLAS